jgi:hypothetical protein
MDHGIQSRLNDGLNDQGQTLSPIYGLFTSLKASSQPLTFDEACFELLSLSQSGAIPIDTDELVVVMNVCREFGIEKKRNGYMTSLDEHQIAVLALYSAEFHAQSSVYRVLNQRLRMEDRKGLKPLVKLMWLLLSAMQQCPSYDGKLVYRGMRDVVDPVYAEGRTVTWYSFSSCTCDIRVQQSTSFLGTHGTRTLFNIELTTNRARIISDYSLMSSEKEILLPASSRFQVFVVQLCLC